MPYCSASDVRLLSGVTSDIVSDADIISLIAFSDQQIDDDIQSFVTVPTWIKNLSSKHWQKKMSFIKIRGYKSI